MCDAFAVLQRLPQRRAQRLFTGGIDLQVCHRQFDRMLPEAVDARKAARGQKLAIHTQVWKALGRRPFREVGVHALAIHHQRRQQPDVAAAVVTQQPRSDCVLALRFDGDVAVRAVLRAELDVQQSQKVIDLGQRRHRGLASTAAGALFDRHRRRDAIDRVDVGARGRLHELARISVQRFQISPLPLAEYDVEGQRRLAAPGDAGNHGELAARQRHVDVPEIVFARVMHADRIVHLRFRQRFARNELAGAQFFQFALVVRQRLAGMRTGMRHHLRGRAAADEFAAGFAALRAEVDDPVGGGDDVEVVFDYQQRIPGFDETAEGAQQLGDVLEVQAGGGFVEQEQRAHVTPAHGHVTDRIGVRRKMFCELQALRFTAGERRHGLAEPQVIEADVRQRLQAAQHVGVSGEVFDRLRNRHLQHIGDAACGLAVRRDGDFEHLRPETPAVAVRATQVHVGQELHLHMLEAVAPAGRAASVAGVEAEHAGLVAAFLRCGRSREQVADRIERAHVARRIRTRGAPDLGLVNHHHVRHVLHPAQPGVRARRFRRPAEVFEQRGVQHVLHQRGFAGTRHAGHANQPVQRDGHVDMLEVVFSAAENLQARHVRRDRQALEARIGTLAPEQIAGSQRASLRRQCRRPVEEHHLAATLSRPRSHVEDAVGGEHDLRIVLHHHQRVAGVAQLLHHTDHPAHVARVQADRRLVQHEQGVGKRSAERSSQVDALDFTAGERARLAVEREIAEPDFLQIGQARADFLQEQLCRFIKRRAGTRSRGPACGDATLEARVARGIRRAGARFEVASIRFADGTCSTLRGCRQVNRIEKALAAVHRQQHQIVDRQPRRRVQLRIGPLRRIRPVAHARFQHHVRVGLAAHPPQQRIRLQPAAFACGARGVRAVFGQQHADVHLVGLGFEPCKKPPHPVPHAGPGLAPVRPLRLAFQHPLPLRFG